MTPRNLAVMTDHPCPFDAGTLLAIGAIAETRSTQPNAPAPPGWPRSATSNEWVGGPLARRWTDKTTPIDCPCVRRAEL